MANSLILERFRVAGKPSRLRGILCYPAWNPSAAQQDCVTLSFLLGNRPLQMLPFAIYSSSTHPW